MDLLYRWKEGTAVEVMAAIPDAPSYSTVRSILTVLEEKGLVTHREHGRTYVYRPTVPKRAAAENALEHMLTTFFDGSIEKVVQALITLRGRPLTREERDRIAKMISESQNR